MESAQTPRLTERQRSLAYSILKIDYGWNGCTDRVEQQEIIDLLINNSDCSSRGADYAALYIAQSIGFSAFRKRIDGKPNNRIVPPQLVPLNSGDACRHSAQSPDAVGQGGIQ
jgi:hypothetical protein